MRTAFAVAFFAIATVTMAQRPGAPSQEELVRQVVAAIEAKDEKTLEQLAISKKEFKKYVWPTVAGRVSGSNMNAERFHTIYVKSSGVGLAENLSEFGGKRWEVVRVSLGAVRKEGKDYRLFLAPEVVVRDSGGQEQTVRLVGGLLEQAGSFKVTTYYRGAQTRAAN